MGDMADFALDHACDDCEEYDDFQSGKFSHQEAYDRGLINEMGGEERGAKGWNTLYSTSPSTTRCNKCNQGDLSWKQHSSGKWWLADSGGVWHTCK